MNNSFTFQVRTRYGETDQMGVIYYGIYPQYLEIARVEWLRSLGISYKELEEKGIMLPVVSLQIDYKKPALSYLQNYFWIWDIQWAKTTTFQG